ncbi:hypothetical protein AgCh_029254 [Apium graveolens]
MTIAIRIRHLRLGCPSPLVCWPTVKSTDLAVLKRLGTRSRKLGMDDDPENQEAVDMGDKHDEDRDDEATDPTDPTNPTKGSSKPGQKRKGTRKNRSKVWDTFDELPIGEYKVLYVRCSKYGFTCIYNLTNGTGNMLKHQKVCLSTGDVRQMIFSSSQGSIA